MVGAAEASACVYLPVVELGDRASKREWAAEKRRFAREASRRKVVVAKQALADGANAPLEIAEMVIPNVRPIFIERSSCGVENEIDLADGEAKFDDWLSGSDFAGRSDELLGVLRNFDGEWLGAGCNAEVRARFAALLGRRMTNKQIRDAYLFLAVRRADTKPTRRAMAFEGTTRRPPVRWIDEEIRRWADRKASGRTLQQAIAQFWSEQEPLLADTDKLCPTAAARWRADQSRLFTLIEARLERRKALRSTQPPR